MTKSSSVPAKVAAPFAMWRRLSRFPAGASLYSIGVVARAPYFGTIVPSVREVRPGYSEVTAPRWFGVRNHIGTFHAIAACNLAELAMGMVMEASVPTTHRWIPKGMQSQYLAKATTRLRAVATLETPIDWVALGEGGELTVAVAITDSTGREVVHCDITCWITPK